MCVHWTMFPTSELVFTLIIVFGALDNLLPRPPLFLLLTITMIAYDVWPFLWCHPQQALQNNYQRESQASKCNMFMWKWKINLQVPFARCRCFKSPYKTSAFDVESPCAYLFNQHGGTEERNVLHRVLSKNCSTETMHDTIFSNNLQLIMWAFLIIYCGALHQNNTGVILKLQDINSC